MATIEGIDTGTVELADKIADRLGITPARVVKMALALLAGDCGVKLEVPRKDKSDAG